MLTSVPVTEIHGRKEGHNANTLRGVHLHKPIKVLGEDFIIGSTILGENSIEARFGGVGLPTAVKKTDETFTNLGNLVTVKTNNRDLIFFVKVNTSVARLPVDAVSDGGVHLLFDLTHDERKERFESGGRWVVFPPLA